MQPFSSSTLKNLPTKFLPFTYTATTKPFRIPSFLEKVKLYIVTSSYMFLRNSKSSVRLWQRFSKSTFSKVSSASCFLAAVKEASNYHKEKESMKIIQQSFSNEFNWSLWIEPNQALRLLYIYKRTGAPHCNPHPSLCVVAGPTHTASHQNTSQTWWLSFFPVHGTLLWHLLFPFSIFCRNNEIGFKSKKQNWVLGQQRGRKAKSRYNDRKVKVLWVLATLRL